MGFWDKLKERNGRNSKKDDDRDVKNFVEEQRIAAITEQKKAQEAKQQQELAKQKEREQQALAEQRRLEEANRKATTERNVINPYQSKTQNIPIDRGVPQRMSAVTNNNQNMNQTSFTNSRRVRDDEEEYVNPVTGKILVIPKGKLAPSGFVKKTQMTNSGYGIGNSSVAQAKSNANALIYGTGVNRQIARKQSFYDQIASETTTPKINVPEITPEFSIAKTSTVIAPVQTTQTTDLLLSPASTNDTNTTSGFLTTGVDSQKVVDDALSTQTVTNNKTALAPSNTGSQWITAAKSGALADSAARVELSTQVDATNMTEEQKAVYAKEQAWKNMSETEKILARQTLPDKDGDLVPDIYDCVPDDYTKQGYADIYLGGKYALGPSKKAQRTIVTGKGRLQMADSMQGPKTQKGAVAEEAMVGNILDMVAGGSAAGKNPALSGNNVINKVVGKGPTGIGSKISGKPLQQSVTLKSKSNANFQVNLNKQFNQKYAVEALNRKKFNTKTTAKSNLDRKNADKAFKTISKRFGL